MSRRRLLVTWLPPLLIVPAALAAALGAGRTEDPAVAMAVVQPLEPGTTWVYSVSDHGEPSGRRTRQVLGPSQLVADLRLVDAVRISSVYDAHPTQGASASDSYVAVEDDELLQFGLIVNGDTYDVLPPAPAYVLPVEEGAEWDFDGTVGGNPFSYEAEVTDSGDVEVGDETFEGCAEITSTVPVADGDEGDVEVQTEWTCPDIGVVRFRTVIESQDVDVTEELVRFRSPGLALDLGPLPDPVGKQPSPEGGDDVSTAAFDEQRTLAVPDGELGRDLAWSEVRDVDSTVPTVSDGRTVVDGDKDGTVTARDEGNGELRWQVSLSPPILAAPTIHEDVVLVADSSKALWALSLADGSATWVRTFDDVVAATPVVADGLVVVPVADTSVVALDVEDGDEEWRTTLAGRVLTPPATDEGVVVLGDRRGALTALDLDDGDVLWSQDLTGGLDLGPVISDGTVLASDVDGSLLAYDLDDGTRRWQRRPTSYGVYALAASEGRVVQVTKSSSVQSYDLRDGRRQWSTRLRDLATPPLLVGDEALVVSEGGEVSVLDLGNGDVVDSWDLPRPPDAFLTVGGPVSRVGDAVVVRGEMRRLSTSFVAYAFATSDGGPRGVSYTSDLFPMPTVPTAPSVLDGDSLYTLTIDDAVVRSRLPADIEAVALVEGSVGLAAADGVVVVADGEEMQGIDGETGEELWSLPTGPASPGSVPATDGETAFVPIREVGLVAADLRSGDVLWTWVADGPAGTSTPLPLADGDVLYAGSGLARHDGRTGEPEWQLGGDLADAVAYAPVAADDDTAYAVLVTQDDSAPTGERSELVAADLRTGRVRWQQPTTGVFGIGPAVGDGVVVTTGFGNVVSGHDTRTGEELWTYRMATAPAGPPLVADGVVQVVERGRTDDLLARNFRVVTLDAATGRFLGAYEPSGPVDSFNPTASSTSDGRLLLPVVNFVGGLVEMLDVRR